MYPAHFYGLFPAFPLEASVFVAMSFDERFEKRWREVIEPAIKQIEKNHIPLIPVRVDASVVGDSILTEILAGIGRAEVVFADITSIGCLDDRPVRNGNVMYEVGLAHAVRLPEEVLLFRSDTDSLLFDTAHVRVNTYSPDEEPAKAKAQVVDAILSALKEVDLRRNAAVRHVTESLDLPSLEVLIECLQAGHLDHPPLRTMGEALGGISKANAIQRLLTLGLLQVRYRAPSEEEMRMLMDTSMKSMLTYVSTRFGDAVCQLALGRIVSNVSIEKLHGLVNAGEA